MRNKLATSLVLLTLSTQISSTALAQGTSFTYQGRLEIGGTPASGPYDFAFTVFDAAVGGSGTESLLLNDLMVSNGLFTATLDFGVNPWAGAARWLEVAVRPGASVGAYTNLVPRQPMTATPYAIRATFATTASNTAWSGLAGLPAGFADGVDNDTTYLAGTGLSLAGNTFSLNPTYTDSRYWGLTGNAGTTAGANFLGTTDNHALELKVNSQRALRLEPGATSPSLVGGYAGNTANGAQGGFIGGGGAAGAVNSLSNNYATIGGGHFNAAGGLGSFIGGGTEHGALGSYSTIAGGSRNRALGDYSFAAGRRAKADHDGTFVWADDNDANFASTGTRQFLVRASGGVGINTSNPN